MIWKLFSNRIKLPLDNPLGIVIFLHTILLTTAFLVREKSPQQTTHAPLRIKTMHIQPTSKQTVSQKKAIPKKQNKPSPHNMHIQKMLTKINQLQAKRPQATTHLSNPTRAELKLSSSHQDSSQDDLLNFLQESIELPKKGLIKVSFQVNCDGYLFGVRILSSDEIDNSQYILEHLKNLQLPKQCCKTYADNKSITLTLHGVE